MKLKNILIVVNDIELAIKFYHDLFGLEVLYDNDGNVIMTEGLVLQDEKIWREFVLYFEENDIEAFVEKLEKFYPKVEYVQHLMTYSWGTESD